MRFYGSSFYERSKFSNDFEARFRSQNAERTRCNIEGRCHLEVSMVAHGEGSRDSSDSTLELP